jgi:hypothetical protein
MMLVSRFTNNQLPLTNYLSLNTPSYEAPPITDHILLRYFPTPEIVNERLAAVFATKARAQRNHEVERLCKDAFFNTLITDYLITDQY